MTSVYLVRHGAVDWASMDARRLRGAANDLIKLSPQGEREARAAALRLRAVRPARVVTSPMTRAVQTAAFICTGLGLELSVDFALREWLVDDTYQWDATTVPAISAEFVQLDGVWPQGERRGWEQLIAVRTRATAALDRAVQDGLPVVAVCHSVVIRSLTGLVDAPTGSIKTYG